MRFSPNRLLRYLRLDNAAVLIGIVVVAAVIEALFLLSLMIPSATTSQSTAADDKGVAPIALAVQSRPSHGARPTDLNSPPGSSADTVRTAAPAPQRDTFDARFWVPAAAPTTDGVAPRPPLTAPTTAPATRSVTAPVTTTTTPVREPKVQRDTFDARFWVMPATTDGVAPRVPLAAPTKAPATPSVTTPVPEPKMQRDTFDARFWVAPAPAPTTDGAAPRAPLAPVTAPVTPPATTSEAAPVTRSVAAPVTAPVIEPTVRRATRPVREVQQPPRTRVAREARREVRSEIVRGPDGRQWKRTTYEVPTAGGGTRRVQVSRLLQPQDNFSWGIFGRGF